MGMARLYRTFIVLLFSVAALLAACESDSPVSDVTESEGDSVVKLPLDSDGKAVQLEKISIWWDASFGAPYETFMGEYLDQAFGRERFQVFEFRRPSGIADDTFHDKNQSFRRLFHADWDVVGFPVFDSDAPVAPAKQRLMIGIPRMAANKEDAHKLIRFLLSEAVQFENV